MALIPYPAYPSAGSYVLRLHRDAQPAQGVLVGRLEHIASGAAVHFTSGSELVAWLQVHAATLLPGAGHLGDTS
jgi:hypothetical protein